MRANRFNEARNAFKQLTEIAGGWPAELPTPFYFAEINSSVCRRIKSRRRTARSQGQGCESNGFTSPQSADSHFPVLVEFMLRVLPPFVETPEDLTTKCSGSGKFASPSPW